MVDFFSKHPQQVLHLVGQAEELGKQALEDKRFQAAKLAFNFCVAATPARDVQSQKVFHNLRALAEQGLGELAAAHTDRKLAESADPVQQLCQQQVVMKDAHKATEEAPEFNFDAPWEGSVAADPAKWQTMACHGQLRIWLSAKLDQQTVADAVAEALSSSRTSSSDEPLYVHVESLGLFCKRAQNAAFAEHESRIYKEMIDCGLEEVCCPTFHGVVDIPDPSGKSTQHWLIIDRVADSFTKQDWRSAGLVAAGLQSLIVLHACGICHGDVDPTHYMACKDDSGSVKVLLVDFHLSGVFGRRCIQPPLQQWPHDKYYKFPNRISLGYRLLTLRWGSLLQHLGFSATRSCDLLAFLYVMAYYNLGSEALPWVKRQAECTSDLEAAEITAAQKVLVTRGRDWTVCGDQPRPVHLAKRQPGAAMQAEEVVEEAANELGSLWLDPDVTLGAPEEFEPQPWRDNEQFQAMMRLLFDAQLHAHSEGEQSAYLMCIDPLFQFIKEIALEEGPELKNVPRDKPSPLGQRSGAFERFERPVALLTPQADDDAGADTEASTASSSSPAAGSEPAHTPKRRAPSRATSMQSSRASGIDTPPVHDRPTPSRLVKVPSAPEPALSPEGKQIYQELQRVHKHATNVDSQHAEHQVHDLVNRVDGFRLRPNQYAHRPGIQIAEMRRQLAAKPISVATSAVWLHSFEAELSQDRSAAEMAQLTSIAHAETEVDLVGTINGKLLSRLPLRNRKQRTVTLPINAMHGAASAAPKHPPHGGTDQSSTAAVTSASQAGTGFATGSEAPSGAQGQEDEREGSMALDPSAHLLFTRLDMHNMPENYLVGSNVSSTDNVDYMCFSEVVDSRGSNAAMNKLSQLNIKIPSMLPGHAVSNPYSWNPLYLATQPAHTVIPVVTMTFRPGDLHEMVRPSARKCEQALLKVNEQAKERTAIWSHLFVSAIMQGGVGVIVPSCPTLWAFNAASFSRDFQLEMLGKVSNRFDNFSLRMSEEVGGLRKKVHSLEDSMQSLQSSHPSSLSTSYNSSLQTSPTFTRQHSMTAHSLYARTEPSEVDVAVVHSYLPKPVRRLLRELFEDAGLHSRVEAALVALDCCHRDMLNFITPEQLCKQLEKEGKDPTALTQFLCNKLRKLADDQAAWTRSDAGGPSA